MITGCVDTKELIAQGVTGSFIWISCYHNS